MADCNTCSQYMSVEDILRRSIKCDANGNVAMQGGVLNVILPQKLILSPHTFTDELDSTDGWTRSFNIGTMSLNTTEKYSGNASIKMVGVAGLLTGVQKDVNLDLSGGLEKSIAFRIYIHSAIDTTNGISFAISTGDNTYANYYTGGFPNDALIYGKWLMVYPSNGFTVGGGTPNWAQVKQIRISVNAKPDKVVECSFDLLQIGEVKKKAVLITFDDGNRSQYLRAYPALKAKNMSATAYVITKSIDGAHISASELLEMKANHWCIGNHTKNHVALGGLTSEQILAELEGGRTDMELLGLGSHAKHVAYPFGDYNDTVLSVMDSWDALSGRTIKTALYGNKYTSEKHWFELNCTSVPYNATVDTVKGYLTNAFKSNSTPCLLFHVITEGAAALTGEWSIANFQALLDYIESEEIQTLTIDEYYRLNSGSISVNHK